MGFMVLCIFEEMTLELTITVCLANPGSKDEG
jgi:hypothetical protein